MKEYVRKNTALDEPKGLEAARKRLAEIKALGAEYSESETEILARRDDDPDTDAEQVERQRHAYEAVMSQMPFLRSSLSNAVLLPDTLGVCKTLFESHAFQLSAAERIADTAHHLKQQLNLHSPHTDAIIDTMSAAGILMLYERHDREKAAPSLMKIRVAIRDAAPALARHFDEVPAQGAKEVLKRITILQDILLIEDDAAESQWALDTLAHQIVYLIRSKGYAPHFSATTVLANMLHTADRPFKKSEAPRDSVTRFAIEVVLETLDPEQCTGLIQRILRTFGLPARMYEDLWKDADEESLVPFSTTPFSRIVDQFESMQALEVARPGSVRELHRTYGIRWFTRYPVPVLIAQHDSMNEKKPYGVILSALVDNNEAFFSDNDRTVVASLAHQLQRYGCALRVIECGGKRDIARRMLKLDAAYGAHHKISFMMVRAHAAKGHMEFGRKEKDGDIELSDLTHDSFLSGRAFFEEDPTFILDGCSVGRRGGIAQKASETFFATVLAPKGMTSALTAITLHTKNDRLVFEPKYEVDTDSTASTPHVYHRGRKR